MISIKKANRLLRIFAFLKIRMISFAGPRIIELNEEKIVIRIKHKKRTINHLGSVYLGALVIGADLAAGFHAFIYGRINKTKLSLVFKDIKGEFISRPTSDVYFVSEQGKQIADMIERSKKDGERYTEEVMIRVFTSYPDNREEVARFSLGLSIKVK